MYNKKKTPKKEEKMEISTNLDLAIPPLDILITPENIDQDRIVNILKESGHYYFDDVEINEEHGITYFCDAGLFIIQYTLERTAALKATTYDKLKDDISNSELLKLLDSIGSYFTIHNRIYDDRYSEEDWRIGIESKIEIFFEGGISESNLVESIKLFTAEYSSMRALHMEQYLHPSYFEENSDGED